MTIGLDFAATEAKTRDMSVAQLRGALADILRTLPYSDDLDREDGGYRGDRYRDEASVYRRELGRRGERGGVR